MTKTLFELNMRKRIAEACINYLNTHCQDDPRYPEALAEYERQLASINLQIAAITGNPPAIVIGLKTAKLFGEVKKG